MDLTEPGKPKIDLSANTTPDRSTNTAINTIRPSWYIWPGTNSGNPQLIKTQSPAQWWKRAAGHQLREPNSNHVIF